MGAKIFISWSGDLSKALGETIKDWIPKVLQSVKPYFSPDDIEKGAKWAKEIDQELESANLGIICLTQDNQHNPWILFEAGALSKNLEESKVCPILFNFDTTDLIGPISSFQATRFNKNDFKKLLESINNSCNDTKLEQKSLDETFEMWWPRLEKSITDILAKDTSYTKPKRRTDRDILEEILELSRSNAKSILSDQRNISRLTLEDLIISYRHIKEKSLHDSNLEFDLAQLRNTIIRLCKECDYDYIMLRHLGSRTYGGRYLSREKNSVDESVYIQKKKLEEESDSTIKE